MSDKTTASPWRGYGLLTAAEYRNQIIQELIEKALGSEADNYKSYDGYVAEWLKSQMEQKP